MTKQTTDIDRRLVKAIGHPLRMQLLTLLNQKVASPRELAEELGQPLGNVSYHVRILADLQAVELVRTEPRRGAVEHYYRALMRPWFKKRDWERLPASMRQGLSGAVLEQVWRETAEAAKSGAFDERTNRHLSRTPLVLDDQGFEELRDLLDELLEKALELEAESAGRLSEGDDDGLASRLVLMHYLTPATEGRRRRSGGKGRRRRGKSQRQA